ncbi:hypothetical protein PENTCL1PPCAC_3071, partial [Pristionchus entomophagus]
FSGEKMMQTKKNIDNIKKLKQRAFEFSSADKIGAVFQKHIDVLLILNEKGFYSDELSVALKSMDNERKQVEQADTRRSAKIRSLFYEVTDVFKITVELLLKRNQKRDDLIKKEPIDYTSYELNGFSDGNGHGIFPDAGDNGDVPNGANDAVNEDVAEPAGDTDHQAIGDNEAVDAVGDPHFCPNCGWDYAMPYHGEDGIADAGADAQAAHDAACGAEWADDIASHDTFMDDPGTTENANTPALEQVGGEDEDVDVESIDEDESSSPFLLDVKEEEEYEVTREATMQDLDNMRTELCNATWAAGRTVTDPAILYAQLPVKIEQDDGGDHDEAPGTSSGKRSRSSSEEMQPATSAKRSRTSSIDKTTKKKNRRTRGSDNEESDDDDFFPSKKVANEEKKKKPSRGKSVKKQGKGTGKNEKKGKKGKKTSDKS